jgi:hypothetical protein
MRGIDGGFHGWRSGQGLVAEKGSDYHGDGHEDGDDEEVSERGAEIFVVEVHLSERAVTSQEADSGSGGVLGMDGENSKF